MSNLAVVHQQEVLGQGFKVYGTVEDPLFLAKDVAEWIEHSNLTMMLKSVDEDEKLVETMFSAGQRRDVTFVTEDGIYELLMLSRKPIAKTWKKEVKGILKQIRLTGGTVQTDREEEFIHNYFPSFSDEIKKAMVLDLRGQNKELKATIQVQAPKVEKYEDFLDKKGSFNPTEVIQKLTEFNKKPKFVTSAQKLNDILRENGIQYKRGKTWYIPKKYHYLIEEGYVITIKDNTSNNFYKNELRWTLKGIDFIVGILEKEQKGYDLFLNMKKEMQNRRSFIENSLH